MSETEGFLKRFPKKYYRALFLAVAVAVFIYLIARNIGAFGNILLVVLGFGAVVLVHEFGHFIVAKISGVKVEAFSIGFPPALVGIQRTENGCRIRLFPRFSEKEGEAEDDRVSFTIGKKGKASETEYRIGIIPAGGFVKMLGQDDIGPVKSSDDPRSYANKPVSTRMAILATGVTFNVISAMLIFMIVFLIGIKLPPAVVGGVVPNSPAALAGLKAGDEIIEIAGKNENLDFSNIQIAAALSDVNEPVRMKVRHEDGSIDELSMVAKLLKGNPMRLFGVIPARSLTIAKVIDDKKLYKTTGLLPGDRIKSVNGKEVRNYWELKPLVLDSLVPELEVVAERKGTDGNTDLIETRIGMEMLFARDYEVESESELYHICSMVPRLCVTAYSGMPEAARGGSIPAKIGRKIQSFGKGLWCRVLSLVGKAPQSPEPPLRAGDVILAVGDAENPTYLEMREAVGKSEDEELEMKVLRRGKNGVDEELVVTVLPRRLRGSKWVQIGAALALDAERPVVAKTISVEEGPPELDIPEGASIVAVDGTAVSNFYDVIREVRRYPGERITIDYRVDEQVAGSVALDVEPGLGGINVKSAFAEYIPFEDLKRPYRAGNPIEAIGMGYKKTIMFITQTYLTLRRLVGRDVSPKSLLGPVGILAASYTIVSERPFVYYMYFLGLISACIAVVNFLPLPPLDGGLVVLLLVEKIKGSALSERTQGIFAYAGWVLIGAFFLYVTFNDVVRTFFGG
ncbi:MAG: site-2 protease family protein [Phycisphaerae bacterium]|nr:site-2 protease family protein [Phycisphaerae bacterium]